MISSWFLIFKCQTGFRVNDYMRFFLWTKLMHVLSVRTERRQYVLYDRSSTGVYSSSFSVFVNKLGQKNQK